MTLTQIEYILAVDEFRHFGKAAQHCHISQPTLSMQIQKLEEEIGVIIFDRSKTPILPTEMGSILITQMRQVMIQYRHLFNLVDLKKDEVSGVCRLGIIPTLSSYLIPLFLQSFSEKYPLVQLLIEEMKTEDMVREIHQDRLDVGLLVTPLHDPSIIEKVLFYEPFYLFVSPEHPLYQKKKIEGRDLNFDEMWLLQEGHCLRNQVLNFCHIDRPKKEGKGLKFESGHLETVKNLVLQCGGYTLLPHLSTLHLTPEQKNMVKHFNAPIPTREVSLIYARPFLKEKIILKLEEEILQKIPSTLFSPKNKLIVELT